MLNQYGVQTSLWQVKLFEKIYAHIDEHFAPWM